MRLRKNCKLLLRDGCGQRVAQVVLVRVVLGRVVAAFFAFGDDVMLERHGVLVALHDDQLPPPPSQVHADGKLVSPGGDTVNNAVGEQELHQRIDGGQDGALEEIGRNSG